VSVLFSFGVLVHYLIQVHLRFKTQRSKDVPILSSGHITDWKFHLIRIIDPNGHAFSFASIVFAKLFLGLDDLNQEFVGYSRAPCCKRSHKGSNVF